MCYKQKHYAACAEHRARCQEVSRSMREASTSRETSALRRAMRGVPGAVRRAQGTVEELERLVHNEAVFTRDLVADLDTKVQDARRRVSLHERMTSVMAKEITLELGFCEPQWEAQLILREKRPLWF